jgi:uncharacterized damage-inducible protein DinB
MTPELASALARYNSWMNRKIYRVASKMPVSELIAERGAFFGSIYLTLNHILFWDVVWMKRFLQHESADHMSSSTVKDLLATVQPRTMNEPFFAADGDGLKHLHAERKRVDRLIEDWAGQLQQSDFDAPLLISYARGGSETRVFSQMVMHMFNHQTHHRGQVTTLISQVGFDIGATDLHKIAWSENHA